MNAFVDKYEDRIQGVLSCFDRMLFRGYLPIMSGWTMAQLLHAHEIDRTSVKPFLLVNAERVTEHALAMAREHGRPFEDLSSKMRKEDAARKIAERDGIDEGLVCVFSDTSGIDALQQLFRGLQRRDIALVLANVNEQPLSLIRRSVFANEIGAEQIVPTLADVAMP